MTPDVWRQVERLYHLALTQPAESRAAFLARAIAFLLLGTLLGIFVDERRRLEAKISRYYDESLDLLATIDRNGRFTHVNPVWERTLGHSAETMCSRPYIEFVHPDDREASSAETVVLARGERDAIGFRN